jgi:hypothetical protein
MCKLATLGQLLATKLNICRYSMPTALEVYKAASKRGLRFQIAAPGRFTVKGPQQALEDFDEALEAHSADLLALVEEFRGSHACSPIVRAAKELLKPRSQIQQAKNHIKHRSCDDSLN